MSRIPPADPTVELSELNDRVRWEPARFIDEEERRYRRAVEAVSERLASDADGVRFVMLCGPSSSGKTTTSRRLCEAIRRRGVNAVTVSLDDFYRPTADVPLQENGKPDFEAPEAIDTARLHRCVKELLTDGRTQLPRYAFGRRCPSEETVTLTVSGNTVVFLEGIQAFAPPVIDGVRACGTAPRTVYVNTMRRFVDGEELLLGRRDLRLTRRLLRDERDRDTTFYSTMTMWEDVIRGQTKYILPYAADADYTVDTAIGYEPSVMAQAMRERLPALFETPFEQQARRLYEVYGRFVPLSRSAIPADSVLGEFV